MANPERGAVRVKSEDGTKSYTLRLRFAALAELQRAVSTPERLAPMGEVLGKIQGILDGTFEDLSFFMQVLLASLQEFHPEFRTLFDVDRFIEDVGGFDGLGTQLRGLSESLTPDQEDRSRRTANPQKARPKRPS